MSETQSILFNRCAGGLLIAGALILLGTLVVVVRFPSPSPPIPEPSLVKEIPQNPLSRRGDQPRAPSRNRFQPSTLPPTQSNFYRTIIDNNLFRPLGWTPPRPVEPYRLLGTILPRDGHTPPQAILQTTATHKTHIVTIGDTLDGDTRVVEIQSKQIRLERAGQQETLHLKRVFFERR